MSEPNSPITRLRASLRLGATVGALAVLACALGGCSVLRPEARAVDARIVESNGNATKIEVALELQNTGKDEVELVEYDYVVTLPDGASYGGKWAALRALPPGRVVAATIPAVLPTASVAAAGSNPPAWRVSGTVRYRDPQSIARILYEAGILKTETGFSGSGSAIRAGLAAPAAATGQ
ncbi:MAG: hypothetical protein RLY21_776 [Planctomycetota bacterium]|jgi:hypothetical protein